MAKKKDLMASRLAGISAAKPVEWSGPPLKRKRQRVDRTETYRFATLAYDDGGEVKCILKDVSKTGAKVIIEGNFELPRKMTLRIDMTGVRKPVHVVWQDETIVGLAFIDTRELPASCLNRRVKKKT